MDMEKIPEILKGIPWVRFKKGTVLFYDYYSLGLSHHIYDFHEALRFIEMDAKQNGVKVVIERLHHGARITVKSRKFPFLPYTDEEADELGLPRHVPTEKGLTKKLREMAINDVIEIHPHKRISAYTLARQNNIKISCHKIDGSRMEIKRIE